MQFGRLRGVWCGRAAVLWRKHLRIGRNLRCSHVLDVRGDRATVLWLEQLYWFGFDVRGRSVRAVWIHRAAVLWRNGVHARAGMRRHGSLPRVRRGRSALLSVGEQLPAFPRLPQRDLHGLRRAGASVLSDRNRLYARQLRGIVLCFLWRFGPGVLHGGNRLQQSARVQLGAVRPVRCVRSAVLQQHDLHGRRVGVRRWWMHVSHALRSAHAKRKRHRTDRVVAGRGCAANIHARRGTAIEVQCALAATEITDG